MLETDESIAAFLRIVGFFFLAVGVYPSIIFTPTFTILSILTQHAEFAYLHILSVLYVISALGYFFVVKARNLEKRGAAKLGVFLFLAHALFVWKFHFMSGSMVPYFEHKY